MCLLSAARPWRLPAWPHSPPWPARLPARCDRGRYMALILHESARDHAVRLICLDRPGYGRSSRLAARSVQQWPADVAQACRQLGVSRFGILAASAGAMYALACTRSQHTKRMVVGKVR